MVRKVNVKLEFKVWVVKVKKVQFWEVNMQECNFKKVMIRQLKVCQTMAYKVNIK